MLFMIPENAAGMVADYIEGNKYGDKLSIGTDTFITDSAHLEFHNINIIQSVSITNAGVIDANINICDGCHVYIQNSGTINGAFNLGNRSEITQIIGANTDITYLGLNSHYNILVRGDDKISMSGLMSVAVSADKVILDDAVLVLDNLNLRNANFGEPVFELVGDVVIHLDSVAMLNGRPILSNVSGNGTVSVHVRDENPLFVINVRSDDGKVYADMVRNTDYVKILNNNTGAYLNFLREVSPNDKLLTALDGATDMNKLNNIISRSAILNPINLMRPIRIFNSFELLNSGVCHDESEISAAPIYIFSDDFNIYGANLGLSFAITDNTSVSATGYAGMMNFVNDIDDFDANIYGGNFGISYKNDKIIFDALVGFTSAKFYSEPVFNGKRVVSNPTGTSKYVFGEIGRRFKITNDISVVPFVGFNADYSAVADLHELDLNAHVGSDIVLYARTGDISYKYGFRTRAATNGEISCAFHINFWSDADDAGGDVQVGTIHDDFGTTYNIRFGAKANF